MQNGRMRLLLVHAHPDDESIGNGATMARYAAEGVDVTLVTCTRGEQGEVIPADLAHLAGGSDQGNRLGDHRVGELTRALAALGVTDHRFLGDPASPGRPAAEADTDGKTVYRDSGMAYDRAGGVVPAPDPPPGAFARADPEEAAGRLARLIQELRPQVVVTYEPGGGYGHPDHVAAHLVTMRALDLAVLHDDERAVGELGSVEGFTPTAGWAVPKVYWTVMPESLTRATLSAMAAAEGDAYRGLDPAGRLPSEVVADDQVTTAIDATAHLPAKVAALRAHETQVRVSPDGAFYALSNGVRRPVLGLEYYRLVRGTPAGVLDDLGRETDLFAGLR
jgi:N-acetyl-1-D-myo-inositol-2-amino-2-deoxy-alpha-D-glucopyranoside deacetylase